MAGRRYKSWLKAGVAAFVVLLLIGAVAGSVSAKAADKESGRPPHISKQKEMEIIKHLRKIKDNIPTSVKRRLSILSDYGCDRWPDTPDGDPVYVCTTQNSVDAVYFDMRMSPWKVYFAGIYVSVWDGSRIGWDYGNLLGEHTYKKNVL